MDGKGSAYRRQIRSKVHISQTLIIESIGFIGVIKSDRKGASRQSLHVWGRRDDEREKRREEREQNWTTVWRRVVQVLLSHKAIDK